jgi:hypothetical protein
VARPGTAAVGGAADAVTRLALAEETACYGRPGSAAAHPDLPQALRTARRGVLRSAPRGVRLRALFWPGSLVTGSGARTAAAVRRRLGFLGHPRRPRAV